MADQSMTRPLEIIKILKIHIYCIPYVATFIVFKNSVLDFIIICCWEDLGSKMQKLHMTKVTMSLLFKVME
jgi:hypothetical protein